MAPKSRFTRLDAFTKTVDEARVRTTSGGIVTIVSLLVVLYLAWGEWSDYRTVVIHPELIVDKGRGERMEIHLNVTFPHVPCELLTLDVMDVSGEQQHGIMHGINKLRLKPSAEGGGVIDIKALNLREEKDVAVHLAPDYCGTCYGADPPPNAQKQGCCNTCEEVRDAYVRSGWAFGSGERIEQCEREHYSEKLEEQKAEGCRIEGSLRVNKVVGNFHLAPGRSFSSGNHHVHDLKSYWEPGKKNVKHDFSHTIHSLRFGPQLPADVTARLGSSSSLPWVNHHFNPLDGTKQVTTDPNFNFMYFVKIVPTSYLPLGWEKKVRRIIDEDRADLGALGAAGDGSVETHQYSVTIHKRSLSGGNDEDHAEKFHAKGGIPGVFFSYDISPMKVINREQPSKSFTGFLTGLCAVIGGTLTVAAAVDRGLFEGTTRLKKLRAKDN